MTTVSETILKDYQLRRTKEQKLAFIDFLKAHYPRLTVEEGGLFKNRNIILGDPAKAKVLLTAHYDTCARMILPNFITPKNMVVYLGYSLLICVPFFLVIAGLNWLLHQFTDSFAITYWGSFLPGMALILWTFMGGKPNVNNFNDNTSGVVTVLELYEAMTPEQRQQVAVVLFDNEENGLLGSGWFARKHKKEGLKEKLVLNYDCVSDGDHIMLVQNKAAKKQYGDALAAAFPAREGKTVYLETDSSAFYPSDQKNFPVNVGVAALKKKKFLGLYMDKIHTPKDTVFDRANIEFLCAGTLDLLNHIL